VIDRRQDAVCEQEPVADEVAVEVVAQDFAAVVDAEGEGQRGAGRVDPGVVAILAPQVPADPSAGIGIGARDLAAVVDVVRGGRQGRRGSRSGCRRPFLPRKPRARPAARSRYVPTISPLRPSAWVGAPGTSIVLRTPFSSRKPWHPPRASS
jgi:hypothetical protein